MKTLRLLLPTGALFAMLLAGATAACSTPPPEIPRVLSEFQESVQAELERMDSTLSRAAAELARTGLTGPEARAILARLCQENPAAVDCAAIDRTGRMVTIEPAAYRSQEGADISQQAQVIALHRTRKPVLSTVFRAVEGFDAADLEWPVVGTDGELIGSVSILFKPEAMLRPIAQAAKLDDLWGLWAMQTDGRILYDADPQWIGAWLPTQDVNSPRAYRRATRERSGYGAYEELGEGSGRKEKWQLYWVTAGLHGTEWRLILEGRTG
jgi:hypothetical protein